MRNVQKCRRRVVSVMIGVVGLMVAAMTLGAHADSRNPNPQVFPIHSNPYGNSYGEWSAR